MPQVDFMILCDYARAEGGVLHIIAGGIDRIKTPSVPSAQNLGIAIRLALTRAECERTHDFELIFQTEDGQRLLDFRSLMGVTYPQTNPAGWSSYGVMALNLGLPLPRFGIYGLELLINGESKKSISIIVEQVDGPKHAPDTV